MVGNKADNGIEPPPRTQYLGDRAMKSHFVECRTPALVYMRGTEVRNKAVNLGLVATMDRKRFAWYPDNTGFPGIAFYGADGKEIAHWAYKHVSDRERQFTAILNGEKS